MLKKAKETVSKVVKKLIVTSKSPYKDRHAAFVKEYTALTKKYKIDFTIMPIDLNDVYQEDGVLKLKSKEGKK